jgi:hypothetical protein
LTARKDSKNDLIAPREAIEQSARGADVIHLDRATARPGVPLLVKRLDSPAHDYYLVPWEDERGIIAVVQVDAVTGVFTSAAAFRSPQRQLVMSAEEATRAVAATFGTAAGSPELVWMPCRESASPLQPLYRVRTGDGEVFVGHFGIQRTLMPFGLGG